MAKKITGWRERRRVAQTRATPLRTLTAGLAQVARAAFSEPYQLAVERHAVGLRRLPRELDGLRIVHLSDIHHSPFTGREQVERAVEVANSLQPDIIALTGDYISHEREYVQPCAEMLGKLRARRGVYACLGNHDRSEEHTSELQSPCNLVCRLLLEKKKKKKQNSTESERRSTHRQTPTTV